jgi:hypothetical protein
LPQGSIGKHPRSLRGEIRTLEMTDRAAKLEAAVRAQDALIAAAQGLLTRYLAKEIESPSLIDALLRLLDGPQQRDGAAFGPPPVFVAYAAFAAVFRDPRQPRKPRPAKPSSIIAQG